MRVFLADTKTSVIQEVEVEKVTDKTITLSTGGRKDIRTRGSQYFTNFEEARAYLVLQSDMELRELKREVAKAERKLEQVRAMQI